MTTCNLMIFALLILFAVTAKTAEAEPKNLADFNVPSVEGLKPYQVTHVDKTREISGEETRLAFYNAEDVLVVTYTIKERVYCVLVDRDWKPPVELTLIDRQGNGKFESIGGDETFSAPDWVTKP